MTRDPVPDLLGEVQPCPIALELLDHAQGVLVVGEVPAEALAQAAVEDLLADVPERRMAEVVPKPDRLDEVLVEAQRPARQCGRCSSPRACA